VIDATSEATPAATDAPPRPARAPRRAPNELTFTLDEAFVDAAVASEPDWLAADRRAAFARYRALQIETNQLYTTYVDLRTADLAGVTPPEPSRTPADIEGAFEPASDITGRMFVSGLGLATRGLSDEARDAGVVMEPLDVLIAQRPELAQRLLGNESSLPLDDKLAQMTRAGWNQGLVVHIPAGVRLTAPISLGWMVGSPGHAILTRTIVDLGEGASASVVEELNGLPGGLPGQRDPASGQSLFTGSLEVHLAADATLEVASIQNLATGTVAFQHRQAEIGEGATLRWALAQLGGRLVRSRVDNRLSGNRGTVEQVEIVFGADDQLFDLTSYTRHIGRDTTGNLLSKAALMDATRSYMKGLIIIEPTAVGTDSFLGEFGMNLSKQARAVAIPSLEIDQPDCRRAAHSSAVGPIDETQLFYLESRGIDPEEARKFIVLGFLEPVVARVPLVSAQDTLRELLEAKWDAGAMSASAAPAA
jgi:Fe-S cluster assembly scaffold protein SufB